MVQSIIHGQKAGTNMDARRKPLSKELEVIQQACEKDEFVQTIMSFFSADTLNKGVYTEQDLTNRFGTVRYKILYKMCLKINIFRFIR